LDPAVAGEPCITSTSLMPTGTPASGGSASPFAANASIFAACASARSLLSARKLWIPLPPSLTGTSSAAMRA
jgi:hypothetical protein